MPHDDDQHTKKAIERNQKIPGCKSLKVAIKKGIRKRREAQRRGNSGIYFGKKFFCVALLTFFYLENMRS